VHPVQTVTSAGIATAEGRPRRHPRTRRHARTRRQGQAARSGCGAKKTAGRATDSPRLEAEGRGDQAKGNLKQAGAKVKDALKH
jgi:uncharacterized protein YjbJ (UPF0337 family)